jgi:hypothetical protein
LPHRKFAERRKGVSQVITNSVKKSKWGFLADWKGVVASTLLVVLGPFAIFSESSVKSGIETWLNSCKVVIEKTPLSPKRIEVRLYTIGKMPPTLPLNFWAPEKLIRQVLFQSTSEHGETSQYGNFAMHPDHNQTCPGELCDVKRLGEGGEPSANPYLTDFSETFDYRFLVDFERVGTPDDLTVRVAYERGLKGGVCRVESGNAFNWFYRTSKIVQFLLIVLLLGILTWVIKVLKN